MQTEQFVASLGSLVILGGKNAKIAGRIHELRATYWTVVDVKRTVSFSETEGRWLLCVPTVNKQRRRDAQQWVLAENDKNYSVHEAMIDED